MPNHLALATLYRFFNNPNTVFKHYYALDLSFKPNVFHMVFCGSSLFPSVEFANKVFYCSYQVLFAGVAFLILRALNGSRWYVLLVPLLFYNCNVSYGFVGCAIAIPFVLAVLWGMLRDVQGAGWWNRVMVASVLVLLFFMHALMAGFALAMFCCWVALRYHRHWKAALARAVCVVPAAVLLATWWMRDSAAYTGPGMLSALREYYWHAYFPKLFLRAGFLVHDNFRFWGGLIGYGGALVFAVIIIACAGVPLWHHRHHKNHAAVLQPVVVFFVCSALCLLLFPDVLPGYSFLFERFSVFVMLSFIFIGSLYGSRRPSRWFPLLVVSASCLHFLMWADCLQSFNEENREFTAAFLSPAQPQATLAALPYDYRFRQFSVYDNFADYFIVWNKGIAVTRTIDERSFPVRRIVDKEVLPAHLEWVGKSNAYDGRYNNMDYILVRGEVPEKDSAYFEGYRLVRRAGKWKLFEKCGNVR